MEGHAFTWDQFWADVLVALQPAVLAVLSAALWYLAAWLRAKAAAVRDAEARLAARETVEAAQAALLNAMRETWQTYVADLKAAAADGKLRPEEKEKAREKALTAFRARLTAEQKQRLEAMLGDLDTWARHELEALMPTLKAEVGEAPARPTRRKAGRSAAPGQATHRGRNAVARGA